MSSGDKHAFCGEQQPTEAEMKALQEWFDQLLEAVSPALDDGLPVGVTAVQLGAMRDDACAVASAVATIIEGLLHMRGLDAVHISLTNGGVIRFLLRDDEAAAGSSN